MQRRNFCLLFAKFASGLVLAEQAFSKRRPRIHVAKSYKPKELAGTIQQRIEQNKRADGLHLPVILYEKQLEEMAANHVLVELVDGDYYFIDRGLTIATPRKGKKKTSCESGPKHVFVYPHVKLYLDQLSHDYQKSQKSFEKLHSRLKITSGARSLEKQIKMRTKGSCLYTIFAAKAETSLEESLHVRGIAVDISSQGMTPSQIKWMRDRLINDKNNGVYVETENQEEKLDPDPIEEKICFHIVVFPKS